MIRVIAEYLTAILCLYGTAFAQVEGASDRESYRAAGEYVVDRDLDLVVAHVVSVDDSRSTVTDPPRVLLSVETVLRGKVARGQLRARWVASLEPPFRCGNESQAERDQWERYNASALKGPRPGETLLLAGLRDQQGEWLVSEWVRFPYSARTRDLISAEARRVDAERGARSRALGATAASEMARDRELLAQANVRALYRASTDVLVGAITSHHQILVRERLWTLPIDPRASKADSFVEYPQRRVGMEDRFMPSSKDLRMLRCRAERRSIRGAWDQGDTSKPLLLFLKRGPFMRQGIAGYRVYWAADSANGLLPAAANTVALVRRIIKEHPVRISVAPCPECGASLESFTSLPTSHLSNVSIKVMRLGAYMQTFVFGLGEANKTVVDFAPCLFPGEVHWNDYGMESYLIRTSPQQLRGIVGAIGSTLTARTPGPRRAPICLVSIRGTVASRVRQFETAFDEGDVKRFAESLSVIMRDDRENAWRVNYWKYKMGPPLTPDRGFQLGGPR